MLSGTIEVRAGRTSHSVDVPTPCSKKAGADPPGSFTSLSEIPLEKVEKAFLHFVSQFTKRQLPSDVCTLTSFTYTLRAFKACLLPMPGCKAQNIQHRLAKWTGSHRLNHIHTKIDLPSLVLALQFADILGNEAN